VRVRALLAFLALAGCAFTFACGPAKGTTPAGTGEVSARIVAAERGRSGVLLVLVDENGERLADITAPPYDDGPRVYTVDTQPVWSPDGRWIAFASNRKRKQGSSIWIVEARADAEPRRLIAPSGAAIDRDPSFAPDGSALMFASDRSGSFDVWRVGLSEGADGWPVAGEPSRVTDAEATDEVSPVLSPDGKALAYAVFDRTARRSGIWVSSPTGRSAHQLTRGELEQTPAWSPDGKWIAFSAPTVRNGHTDMDIHIIRRDGVKQQPAIVDPIAHETDPAWSADGRYLFATAVIRNERTGAPFFWSVVFVDGDALERGVRSLQDPVVAPRVGFALAPQPLHPERLAELPAYDRGTVLAALRDQCADFAEQERPEACRCLVETGEDRPEACKNSGQ